LGGEQQNFPQPGKEGEKKGNDKKTPPKTEQDLQPAAAATGGTPDADAIRIGEGVYGAQTWNQREEKRWSFAERRHRISNLSQRGVDGASIFEIKKKGNLQKWCAMQKIASELAHAK